MLVFLKNLLFAEKPLGDTTASHLSLSTSGSLSKEVSSNRGAWVAFCGTVLLIAFLGMYAGKVIGFLDDGMPLIIIGDIAAAVHLSFVLKDNSHKKEQKVPYGFLLGVLGWVYSYVIVIVLFSFLGPGW